MTSAIDIDQACALLGGLSPATFMRKHWQRKPLLVRQALPGVLPPVTRNELFDLATRDDVESRCVQQLGTLWKMRQGPLSRRMLPAVRSPHWTLLVQGLDVHNQAAHELLSRFRFVPEARLDDLMMSWASDGGGVGPHLDSYDVFLIQVQGQRRWRTGPGADKSFVDGLPLKILRNFVPTQEWLLEPGDMLYLPPQWAHEGVAVGQCMTCSVGFRAPRQQDLLSDLLGRLADEAAEEKTQPLVLERTWTRTQNQTQNQTHYRDADEAATVTPGAIPERLQSFARASLMNLIGQPHAMERVLGEALTEPKDHVWFERATTTTNAPESARTAAVRATTGQGVVLARGTRMMYDAQHLYINGESYRAAGRDAKAMRQLADARALDSAGCARLSADARVLLTQWLDQGWLRAAAQ